MKPDATTLLCAKEAADLLGISDATLAAWRSRRTGPPYVKVGRVVRYQRAELFEWIEQCSVKAVRE